MTTSSSLFAFDTALRSGRGCPAYPPLGYPQFCEAYASETTASSRFACFAEVLGPENTDLRTAAEREGGEIVQAREKEMVDWLVMDAARRLRRQDERNQQHSRNRMKPEREERFPRFRARQHTQRNRFPAAPTPQPRTLPQPHSNLFSIAGHSDATAGNGLSMVLDLSDIEDRDLTPEGLDMLQRQFLNDGPAEGSSKDLGAEAGAVAEVELEATYQESN